MNKKTVGIAVGISAASLLAGWFMHGMFGGKGGGNPGMGGMQMPPATVVVQTVLQSHLQTADEYIAKVDPVEDVMIRSEVSGYIDSVHFTEGGMVKEGDLLFTIDKRSYKATADAAEAELNRAQKLYDRMKNADARSISKSDLETAESDLLRAQAAFRQANVSLDYTEIKAPVSGRIGAAQVTKGNYVTSASGALARIVQIDPIRVTFSLTDREHITLRRRELSGRAASLAAEVILPDGSVFPNSGKKDFDDNAINPETGTIAVRYLLDNTDGLLVPGGYVTVRLRNPAGETGIKIPLRSLLLDQDGAYVLTVDEKAAVGTIHVKAGEQVGADVIILSGLKEGDRIIVDGIQKARPGATVNVIQAEVK
ncbi:MAG TPA: efflux transporter periplasmic adaptor subunit [Candidatus Riflebacteria bacterium]|nr:efflux transporter periplasmic adaptor subunit [Candidatus Riflebacteria bacterium]